MELADRNDGNAVTCDDFRQAMADASGRISRSLVLRLARRRSPPRPPTTRPRSSLTSAVAADADAAEAPSTSLWWLDCLAATARSRLYDAQDRGVADVHLRGHCGGDHLAAATFCPRQAQERGHRRAARFLAANDDDPSIDGTPRSGCTKRCRARRIAKRTGDEADSAARRRARGLLRDANAEASTPRSRPTRSQCPTSRPSRRRWMSSTRRDHDGAQGARRTLTSKAQAAQDLSRALHRRAV